MLFPYGKSRVHARTLIRGGNLNNATWRTPRYVILLAHSKSHGVAHEFDHMASHMCSPNAGGHQKDLTIYGGVATGVQYTNLSIYVHTPSLVRWSRLSRLCISQTMQSNIKAFGYSYGVYHSTDITLAMWHIASLRRLSNMNISVNRSFADYLVRLTMGFWTICINEPKPMCWLKTTKLLMGLLYICSYLNSFRSTSAAHIFAYIPINMSTG